MIITLEHEDIEAALLAWMNDKGMVAAAETTSISMSKARNTGRITAVIDPNGNPPQGQNVPEAVVAQTGTKTEAAQDSADEVKAPAKKLFDTA